MDEILDNVNTKNNKCVKGIYKSKIKNIGYSDLFGKPHINQGETKNLVSRSFYSDTGSISKTIQGGKCIKDKEVVAEIMRNVFLLAKMKKIEIFLN